jgi:hypothetical protein
MSQLATLIWLKWTLFRNALRSRKAKINQLASIVGTLVTLGFSLLVALGLGIGVYALTSELGAAHIEQAKAASKAASEIPPAHFIVFMIFSFLYLLWATLPLSLGSSAHFDPGRLLMYPISLRKLFALDLVSELTSLPSLFAIPAVVAVAAGAALGAGSPIKAAVGGVVAIAFGIVLAKWLATAIGALTRRRRTRGETILALIAGLAGLAAALMGQLAPVVVRHAESFRGLRWTPPGAAAFALTAGLGKNGGWTYALALTTLCAYTLPLVFGTYWIAQRSVLGKGGRKRRTAQRVPTTASAAYTGWDFPFLPADLSALIEKELRYALRNAPLRMMALMPLILLVVRFMNTRRPSGPHGLPSGNALAVGGFLYYGQGLLVTGGVLYVFMILSGIACNQFAFEEGGMRTYLLAPVERRKILIGKNVVLALIAFVFSTALLLVNEIVFRDLTPGILLFGTLSFLVFAVTMAVTGNWLSIRFPKRMKFGKRTNVSGMAGLLIGFILLAMALPSLAAVGAGYFAQSLLIEYVTLALLAGFALLLYYPLVRRQGRSLERHERAILEVVSKEADS